MHLLWVFGFTEWHFGLYCSQAMIKGIDWPNKGESIGIPVKCPYYRVIGTHVSVSYALAA